MANYLLKRLFSSIVAFFIFTGILFFSVNLLIPNDYVVTLALQLTGTEARDALREELGLNLPLGQQYLNWLQNLLSGDLGQQFTIGGRGGEVSDLIGAALPATLLIFVTGAVLAFLIGRWLGEVTAWRTPRWASGSLVFGAIASYTAFPPWLAFLLGFILVDQLGLLPVSFGLQNLSGRLWRNAPFTLEEVLTRMLLIVVASLLLLILFNWLSRRYLKRGLPLLLNILLFLAANWFLWGATGIREYALDLATVGAIPLLTFTLLSFGDTMLITRASMQDVKHEAYIETARAKGLSEKEVRRKHAGRNALLPVLSQFVISIPYLLTAIVIVERATGWAGIGNLLFNSMADQNTFVYMGVMVLVALLAIVARFMLDIAYAYLDPRIRFGTAAWEGNS